MWRWFQQPTLEEIENLLSSKELLDKQLASVFFKNREEDAIIPHKRNFKGKIGDMPQSRSLDGSCSRRENDESSNYYGKKPLRCYRYGEVGHMKKYCRSKKNNMAKNIAEEEQEWGNI